jgi:hypothetical protein
LTTKTVAPLLRRCGFRRRLRPGVRVSRRVFTSSLKRCGSSEPNPPGAGSPPDRSRGSHSPSGGVGSQGRPARAASKGPGRDTRGGPTMRPCLCARVLTRLQRCGRLSISVRGVGDSARMTCRVRGGVTWSKGWENLTDEGPRRSRVSRPGISSASRPKPKCAVRRRRARGVPRLSLLGDHSVSGGGRPEKAGSGDQEDTPTIEGWTSHRAGGQ